MFKYISQIIAQFSTPQKVIALSLILLSIVIITVAPLMIEDKSELSEEIELKTTKIRELQGDLNYKDSLIRNEQMKCTNQIVEREKQFISLLDELKNKAKDDDNRIIRQTNLEAYSYGDSLKPSKASSIIVKTDNSDIIRQIELIKEKLKN